jgi:hypothetical protein
VAERLAPFQEGSAASSLSIPTAVVSQDFGVVGSNFIQGDFVLFVLPCIGTDLTMGRSLVQGVLLMSEDS